MDGMHLLGEWFGCPGDTPEMVHSDALRSLCLAATKGAGLSAVGDKFHQFAPQGVTGMVLLAESHLAIHTWPETGFVSVDVYVCNFSADNTAKAQHLFDALRAAMRPVRVCEHALRRGALEPVRKAA
ncbi:MAG: adenosylmethionine decarboxylase [Betaproteobacteria bacterium]|nr:adenosylmethionine decarboxylase [Betaproteobacteria bacterium]